MAGKAQIRRLVAMSLLAAATASSAPAQILGGGLPRLPGSALGGIADVPRIRAPDAGAVSALAPIEKIAGELTSAPLADLRRLTMERLLKAHPDLVEADDSGRPVVRGEILATGLSSATVARLRQAGF